jgi:hypothetical protein
MVLGSPVVNERFRRLRDRPALLMTVLLVLLAIWEIATLAHVHAAAPGDADWKAATALIHAELKPGQDLIVFAPAWVDPVGRQWLGDQLTLDDLGRMDAAHYTRIWEVTVRGAQPPETEHLGAPTYTVDFGGVRVRRFEQKPAVVVWAPQTGQEILEVAHTPHRCIRGLGAHEWKGITTGATLQVYAGLADVWARKENRAFAKIRVLVDGQEVGHTSVGNDDGWKPLAPIATTPGVHDLVLDASVDPERGDPKRQRLDVCLAAEARTP